MKPTPILLTAALIAAASRAAGQDALRPHLDMPLGLHLGTPAKVSYGIGVSLDLPVERGHWRDTTWVKSWRDDRHLFLMAEPGIKGGRLSLGYARVKSDFNSAILTSARVSAFRRWSSDHDDPGAVFIGPELALCGIADVGIGARIGILRRIGVAPDGKRRTLFAIDYPLGCKVHRTRENCWSEGGRCWTASVQGR